MTSFQFLFYSELQYRTDLTPLQTSAPSQDINPPAAAIFISSNDGGPKRGSARNMRRRQKAGKGLWEPEYQRLGENGCV